MLVCYSSHEVRHDPIGAGTMLLDVARCQSSHDAPGAGTMLLELTRCSWMLDRRLFASLQVEAQYHCREADRPDAEDA